MKAYRKDVNRLYDAFIGKQPTNIFQRGISRGLAEVVGLPYAIVDAVRGHPEDVVQPEVLTHIQKRLRAEQRRNAENQGVIDKSAPLNKVKKKSKQEIREMPAKSKKGRKKFGPPVSMKLAKKRLMARSAKATMPIKATFAAVPIRKKRATRGGYGAGGGGANPFNPIQLSYMQDINCGPMVRIKGGRNGNVIIQQRRRIGTVIHATFLSNYAGTTTVAQGPAISFDSPVDAGQSITSSTDTCIPFNPSMPVYWPDPINSMAYNFNFHRCLNASFDYHTDQTTSVAYRIYFGYTEDPDYMEKVGAGSPTGVSNIGWNISNVVALPDSTSFAVWNNKSYRVPLNQNQKRWCVPTSYGSIISSAGHYQFGLSGSTAVSRQEFQGMFYIAGGSVQTIAIPNLQVLGELYMNVTWELSDLSGVQTTATPSLIQSLSSFGVPMPNVPEKMKEMQKRGHRHTRRVAIFDEGEKDDAKDREEKFLGAIEEAKYNFTDAEVEHGKFETTDSVDKLTEHIENLLSLQEQLKETKTKISDVSEKKDITILAKEARELLKRFKTGDLNSHEASKIALDDSPILIEPSTLPLK